MRSISPAGDRGAPTCWSTRSRTSTPASSGWRCSWPPRRTASSSSATTTRASTGGASPTCAGCFVSPTRCRACGGWIWPSTTAARRRSWRARSAWWSTTGSASQRRSAPVPGRQGGWCSLPRSPEPLLWRPCSGDGHPTGRAAQSWRERGGSSCRRWRPALRPTCRSAPTGSRCQSMIPGSTSWSSGRSATCGPSLWPPGWRPRAVANQGKSPLLHPCRPPWRHSAPHRTIPTRSRPGPSPSSARRSSAGRSGCRMATTW